MIILSGSHTLLGSYMLPLLRNEYQVCAFDDERGDIRDKEFLEKLCSEIRPTVFINCAQIDNVEECEYKREDAYTLNGRVPSAIAEVCAFKKIFFVQMSSSYVFDGEKVEPYCEDDKVNPRTVYGDSKAMAEKSIISSGADYLIVRLPHLYGKDSSFLSPYIEKMKTGDFIPVISNQLIMPTYAHDAALMIYELIRSEKRGVYNCGNEGVTALSHFLYEVANTYSGISGRGFTINLQQCDAEEFLSPCDFPANNCLDLTKIKREGIVPRHWKAALDDFISVHAGQL